MTERVFAERTLLKEPYLGGEALWDQIITCLEGETAETKLVIFNEESKHWRLTPEGKTKASKGVFNNLLQSGWSLNEITAAVNNCFEDPDIREGCSKEVCSKGSLFLLSLRQKARIVQAQQGWMSLVSGDNTDWDGFRNVAREVIKSSSELPEGIYSIYAQAFLGFCIQAPTAEDRAKIEYGVVDYAMDHEISPEEAGRLLRVVEPGEEEPSWFSRIMLGLATIITPEEVEIKSSALKGRAEMEKLQRESMPFTLSEFREKTKELLTPLARQIEWLFSSPHRRHCMALLLLGFLSLYNTSALSSAEIHPHRLSRDPSSKTELILPYLGDFKEEDLYLSVDKNILKSDYPESIMVTERNYRRTDDYYWWPTREPVYLSLPTKTDEVAQWVTLAWNEKRPIVPQPARLVGLGLLDEYPKELVFADGSVTDPAQIKKFFLQQEDLADRVVNDQGEVVLEETLLSSWVSSVRLDNGKYMEKDGCVYDIAEELDWASPVATSEYLTDGSLRVLLWDNDYWVEYVDSVETGRLFDKNNVPLRIVLEKSGEASTILTSLAFLTSEDSHSPILTEGQGSVFVNPAEVSRWLEFRAMLEGANPAGTLDRLEKGLFRATDERSYFTEYISFDDHDYVRIGRFVRNSEYVLILTFLPTAEDGAVEHVEYPLCVQMYDKNGRSIGRLDHWGNVYH